MSLQHSTEQIQALSSVADLDATADALRLRGRAVVEFAAKADLESLHAAKNAGDQLINQLLDERRRLLTELHNTEAMLDALLRNRTCEPARSSILA